MSPASTARPTAAWTSATTRAAAARKTAAAVDGGRTKLGAGTLTLTGPLSIDAGTLGVPGEASLGGGGVRASEGGLPEGPPFEVAF